MTSDSDRPESGITDDQLPEDVRPGEDNPLAEGLPPGERVDLDDGKRADEMPPAEEDAGGGGSEGDDAAD